MPIKAVKRYSDRGNIKDLSFKHEAEDPPTSFELRLKELYAFAQENKNQELSDSLGFIVMNQSGDKSAYPITIYRHREYIKSLSVKLADKIEKTTQELSECFSEFDLAESEVKQKKSLNAVIGQNDLVKTAEKYKKALSPPSFRRKS